MADGSNPTTPTGPLASLITEAQNGNLSVSFSQDVVVNADEFAYIIRDCKAFKTEITNLQLLAKDIASTPNWGLGEVNPALSSAQKLVSRFRSKAMKAGLSTDSDDNIYDILDQHYKIVDDLQTLHQTIADNYSQHDADFAAEFKKKQANLEPSPIGKPMQPGMVPTNFLGKSS
jgi:hypothetical protein